jgi:hypothetical protein
VADDALEEVLLVPQPVVLLLLVPPLDLPHRLELLQRCTLRAPGTGGSQACAAHAAPRVHAEWHYPPHRRPCDHALHGAHSQYSPYHTHRRPRRTVRATPGTPVPPAPHGEYLAVPLAAHAWLPRPNRGIAVGSPRGCRGIAGQTCSVSLSRFWMRLISWCSTSRSSASMRCSSRCFASACARACRRLRTQPRAGRRRRPIASARRGHARTGRAGAGRPIASEAALRYSRGYRTWRSWSISLRDCVSRA